MRRVGGAQRRFRSHNTCQKGGRLFNFTQNSGSLVVTEAILGETMELRTVDTRQNCLVTHDPDLGCCEYGDYILVMAATSRRTFAALLTIDEGELTRGNPRLTKLTVFGGIIWHSRPFLCQMADNQVLLYFREQDTLWCCNISPRVLRFERLEVRLHASKGCCSSPIRLPDGMLLLAGSNPISTNIAVLSRDAPPRIIGSIPGEARADTSVILVKERFVVGFGGAGLNDLWVFDLQNSSSSIVWESGEWAPPSPMSVLVIKGGTLYIIGREAHSITLAALAGLIDDEHIRQDFCEALGLPPAPQYNVIPLRPEDQSEMRDFGGSLPSCPRHTLWYNGRLLHFSSSGSQFLISEVVFHSGGKNRLTYFTEVECIGTEVACCRFRDGFLMMGGANNSVYAALVTIADGRLSSETVHTTALGVRPLITWRTLSFLVQIAENTVFLHSSGITSTMWSCRIKGNMVELTELSLQVRGGEGFGVLPIRLPDGGLLFAGSALPSTELVRVFFDNGIRSESIGTIPGVKRLGPSMIVLANRFILGCGGYYEDSLDDLWIFDLSTQKASIIWEEAGWVPGSLRSLLFIEGERLFVITGNIFVIPFARISERIDDNEVRAAFCEVLRLPLTPKYVLPPFERGDSLGMKRVNGVLPVKAYSTVQCGGRIFHFSLSGERDSRDERLLISEVIFYGRRVRLLTHYTLVKIYDGHIGCCRLGDRIFVISGRAERISALLVQVGEGRLSDETVRITSLRHNGRLKWHAYPFLCQVSGNQVLLYFDQSQDMWYCDINGEELVTRRVRVPVPVLLRFVTFPIYRAERDLIVIESRTEISTVYQIVCDDEPRMCSIGNIPWAVGDNISSTLISNRFVLGFGGQLNNFWLRDIWLFDLKTLRSSKVRRLGEWHPGNYRVFIVVLDGVLYLMGGKTSGAVYSISLSALSELIIDDQLRTAFRFWLGKPVAPPSGFGAAARIVIRPAY